MINELEISEADITNTEERILRTLNNSIQGLNIVAGSASYDILVRSMAYVVTLVTKEADRMRSLVSASRLAQNNDTSSRLSLEDIMSNWFITRKLGGLSKGSIRIITSRPSAITISNSIEFVRGAFVFSPNFIEGSKYYSTSDYSEITVEGQPAYYITIPVISAIPGLGSFLPAGTFTTTAVVPFLIKAENIYTFSEAAEEETNSELIERAKASVSLRGFITKRSIIATILDLGISSISRVVVISSGDFDMTRDLISTSVDNITFSNVSSVESSMFNSLGKSDVVIFDSAHDVTQTSTSNSSNKIEISSADPHGMILAVKAVATNTTLYNVSCIPAVDYYGTACIYKIGYRFIQNEDRFEFVESKEQANYTLATTEFKVDYTNAYYLDSKAVITTPNAFTEYSIISNTHPDIGTVNSLVESDNLKCAVGSVELRQPIQVIINITNLVVSKNINSPFSTFPISTVKAAISSFIESYDQSNKLSITAISKFVADNLYQIISYVDVSNFSVDYYTVDLKSGVILKFSSANYITVEDSSFIANVSNIATSSLLTTSQKRYLGMSDRSCKLICRPDNITLRVI